LFRGKRNLGIIFQLLKEAYVICYSFPVDQGGTLKSVVQYFQETYGFAIQHTYLPCLQVGNQQHPNYLPMEVSLMAITSDLALF
jgi:hypothetical protein